MGRPDADAYACQGKAGRAGSPAGPPASGVGHQAALPPALPAHATRFSTAVTLDGMLT